MKKTDQRTRRTVAFDIVPSKNGSRSRSFKCLNASKVTEKIERHQTSRVKFKENLPNTVKNSKSVQFVRNTERPVKKFHSVVSFTPGVKRRSCRTDLTEDVLLSSDNAESAFKSDLFGQCEKLKLNTPELCTSLRIANKLLEEASAENKTVLRRVNLCSDNAQNLKAKVLRKVNIPFEEQIYKDLVDLKVSEDDWFVGQEKIIKSKNFERTCKDQEPELSSFYKPSFDQEFVLKIEKLNIEPENFLNYKGFSLSDRMKNWELS